MSAYNPIVAKILLEAFWSAGSGYRFGIPHLELKNLIYSWQFSTIKTAIMSDLNSNDSIRPCLTAVMPVYNECATIVEIVKVVLAQRPVRQVAGRHLGQTPTVRSN